MKIIIYIFHLFNLKSAWKLIILVELTILHKFWRSLALDIKKLMNKSWGNGIIGRLDVF